MKNKNYSAKRMVLINAHKLPPQPADVNCPSCGQPVLGQSSASATFAAPATSGQPQIVKQLAQLPPPLVMTAEMEKWMSAQEGRSAAMVGQEFAAMFNLSDRDAYILIGMWRFM